MITVGEITRVYTDINNTVICDVDISMFRSTLNNFDTSNKLNGSIFTATICTPPGLYMPYDVGDVVYVSFINDEISTPVILGLVHKNLPKEGDSSSYAYFKDLSVTNNAKLPENTTIGDVTFNKIKSDILTLNNNASNIQSLNETLIKLKPIYRHDITFTMYDGNEYWVITIYSTQSSSFTLNWGNANSLGVALFGGKAWFVSGNFEVQAHSQHIYCFGVDSSGYIRTLCRDVAAAGTYEKGFQASDMEDFIDDVSLL